jgi:hypothetical protein
MRLGNPELGYDTNKEVIGSTVLLTNNALLSQTGSLALKKLETTRYEQDVH